MTDKLLILGVPPISTQTASINARHGAPRKSPLMMAASWFSNTPEKGEQASRLFLSQPLPKEIFTKRSGKLSSRRMKVSAKASNCDRRTVVSGYFSSLITAHSALFTSFSPLFPALRSSPTAVQEPPAKSKFLAIKAL